MLNEDYLENQKDFQSIQLLKKTSCPSNAPYLNSGSCYSLRECNNQQVNILGDFEFNCTPCSVWTTGYNGFGQLGTGQKTDLTKFTNVSDICFDHIYLAYRFAIGYSDKTYFAGMQLSADGANSTNFSDLGQAQIGIFRTGWIQMQGQKINVSGNCSDGYYSLGFVCKFTDARIESDTINLGIFGGEMIKQVGGTYYVTFIVTQSAIYSTNKSNFTENGIRTQINSFWGKMKLPTTIKIITKAWYFWYNAVIYDQDGNVYANGYNKYKQLCISSISNQPEFTLFGKLKNLLINTYASFHVHINGSVTFCGKLNSSLVSTYVPLILEMPSSIIIDLSATIFALTGLFSVNGKQTVYYMETSKLNDLGTYSSNAKWTSLETAAAATSNSFALRNYYNNALIYGCSRLQPFRYNGLCQENCSNFVFFENGFEKCKDTTCDYSFTMPLDYPRNWSVCIVCESYKNNSDGTLLCRQNCDSDQFAFYFQKDDFTCFVGPTDHLTVATTNKLIWNQTSSNVFEVIPECYYSGCIHDLICTRTCSGAQCDVGLIIAYTNTGMTCNETCSSYLFLVNTSSQICQTPNCADYTAIFNSSLYSCVSAFSELASNGLASSVIWNESQSHVLTPVLECYYHGCIHEAVCQQFCSAPFCDGALVPVYSESGMVCNASCAYPEFNLSSSSQQCKNESCAHNTIVVNANTISCLANLLDIQVYPETNGSIWNLTAGSYQKVQECDYGGCVHTLVCTQSCPGARCDADLVPIYSESGMVCNASCAFPEFNLSTSEQICRNSTCQFKTVVLGPNTTSCIYSLDQLAQYSETSSSIWFETYPNVFQTVSECSYTGCIHDLVCQESCSGQKCDLDLISVYSESGMVCSTGCKNWQKVVNEFVCKSGDCTLNKLVISAENNSYYCLQSLTELNFTALNMSWTENGGEYYVSDGMCTIERCVENNICGECKSGQQKCEKFQLLYGDSFICSNSVNCNAYKVNMVVFNCSAGQSCINNQIVAFGVTICEDLIECAQNISIINFQQVCQKDDCPVLLRLASTQQILLNCDQQEYLVRNVDGTFTNLSETDYKNLMDPSQPNGKLKPYLFFNSSSNSFYFNPAGVECFLYQDRFYEKEQSCDLTLFKLNASFTICQAPQECRSDEQLVASEIGFECVTIPTCGSGIGESCIISTVFEASNASVVLCDFVKQFTFVQVCVQSLFNLSRFSSRPSQGQISVKKLCPLFQMLVEDTCTKAAVPTSKLENFEQVENYQNSFQNRSKTNNSAKECSEIVNKKYYFCEQKWKKENKNEY